MLIIQCITSISLLLCFLDSLSLQRMQNTAQVDEDVVENPFENFRKDIADREDFAAPRRSELEEQLSGLPANHPNRANLEQQRQDIEQYINISTNFREMSYQEQLDFFREVEQEIDRKPIVVVAREHHRIWNELGELPADDPNRANLEQQLQQFTIPEDNPHYAVFEQALEHLHHGEEVEERTFAAQFCELLAQVFTQEIQPIIEQANLHE